MAAANYHNTNISGASFASEDSSGTGHGPGFEASDFSQFEDWLDAIPPDFTSFSSLLSSVPNEVEVESGRTINAIDGEQIHIINIC